MRTCCAPLHWAPTLAPSVLACARVSGAAIPASSSAHLLAGCTAAFGVAQVERLLNVLGRGDSSAVEKLIVTPDVGRDGLEMTPTLQDFLVHGDLNSSSDNLVHDPSDLVRLVHA